MKRKTRHSINEPGDAHELTFTCYRRCSFFEDDALKNSLLKSIAVARKRHNFLVWAYVIMPNHVHLLIHPNATEYKMAVLLKAIKQPFSQALIYEWKSVGDSRLLETKYAANEHRFWQPGGGYDRNLTSAEAIWSAIEYIHENPVRRGLVETATDWLWSSARFYEQMDGVAFEVDQCDVWR